MINKDENNKVISVGAINITDVFRLCTYIKPFSRKLKIKLRKEESIDYHTNYPFEVYYATRIFNTFIKMVLRDVIFNHILYKHNYNKSIYLRKETNSKVIRNMCRKYGVLPSMPIYKVVMKMNMKENFKFSYLDLYNEILNEYLEHTYNGTLQEGIRETKTADDYLKQLTTRFPHVSKQIIKRIVNDGVSAMYMPVKNHKVDFIVCDFHHAKDRICAISNKDSYKDMLPHYNALIRYTKKYKDDNFYAVFTDEEQAKIEAGEKDVSGLCIFTLAYVKLYVKGKKRDSYKHIYKIKNTNQSTYKYYIQRSDVKTSSIKYLYRRFNERYEPVNNTK